MLKKNTNTIDPFIFEFINTLVIYIDANIRQISLDGINHIFLQILNKGGNKFIHYLKKKSFEKWVESFFGNKIPSKSYMKNIINENLYPTIHSQHSILVENFRNNNKEFEMFDENDISDQHFYNKLKDVNVNKSLIEKLGQYFIE